MPQTQVPVKQVAFVIRSAVLDGSGHAAHGVLIRCPRFIKMVDSANAAHGFTG